MENKQGDKYAYSVRKLTRSASGVSPSKLNANIQGYMAIAISRRRSASKLLKTCSKKNKQTRKLLLLK